MKNLTVLAVLFASTNAVHAEQIHDASAIATGMQKTETHVISEGHIVLHTISEYQNFDSADPSNPQSTASGTCFGAVEIVGATAAGGGNCVFADADGDKITNTWTTSGFGTDGALLGTWVYTGGSGKFLGLSGGGSFSSATDQATGKFVNTITGAAIMR